MNLMKTHLVKVLAYVLVLSATQFAYADIQTSRNHFIEAISSETFDYPNYYRIHVNNKSNKIDLLNFDTVNETFPKPVVKYKRDTHYGSWLKDPVSCLNTRAKVLIRDSVTPVKFVPTGCTVESGDWNDPYTGRLHTKAKDIQIDHLVALKNSYQTGGHEWSQAKRCLYANYMGNNFHLLSVDGPENLHKGDVTPAQYVPPNKAYTCEFLKNWLHVKLIWALRITPVEGNAIQKFAVDNHCDRAEFAVSAQSLAEQHRYMEDNADLCGIVEPTTPPGTVPDPGNKPTDPIGPVKPPTTPAPIQSAPSVDLVINIPGTVAKP